MDNVIGIFYGVFFFFFFCWLVYQSHNIVLSVARALVFTVNPIQNKPS